MEENETFKLINYIYPGVMACTCNPATLGAEFRRGLNSIPAVGNSPSIGEWIKRTTLIKRTEKTTNSSNTSIYSYIYIIHIGCM